MATIYESDIPLYIRIDILFWIILTNFFIYDFTQKKVWWMYRPLGMLNLNKLCDISRIKILVESLLKKVPYYLLNKTIDKNQKENSVFYPLGKMSQK